MGWLRDQVKKGLNPRTYVLVGFLILVLLWIQSLNAKQKAVRARAAASVAAQAVPPPPARPAASKARPSGAMAGAVVWGRDPFERRVLDGTEPRDGGRSLARGRERARPTGLYLQGIMEGPRGRTALINGEVVREGERFGSREVLQIGRRSVIILNQGTVTTLTLKGDG